MTFAAAAAVAAKVAANGGSSSRKGKGDVQWQSTPPRPRLLLLTSK